ncbi:MAG: hypothetical protein ABI295_12370 [Xanthomarina sp.]
MKKILLFSVFASFSFALLQAQDDFVEKAKNGGFYVGANIGLPLSTSSDMTSFNFGFDGAYLFEVIDNLEIGGLLGYTHFVADGAYTYKAWNDAVYAVNFKDASFIPVAASARYYFAEHKFFGGLDLGLAINLAGDAKTGFYARPKFGYNLGTISLIASFQSVSGGVDYGDAYYGGSYSTTRGFSSFNFGVEYGF